MMQTSKNKGGLVKAGSAALAVRKQTEEAPLFPAVLKAGGISLLLFFLAGAILITAATLFAYAQPDPNFWVAPLSLVALLVAGFTAGFCTSKQVGEAPLLCGVICGAMVTFGMLLLTWMLGFLETAGFVLWQEMVLHGGCVVFCVLGAFAGGMKRKVRSAFLPKKARKSFYGR